MKPNLCGALVTKLVKVMEGHIFDPDPCQVKDDKTVASLFGNQYLVLVGYLWHGSLVRLHAI